MKMRAWTIVAGLLLAAAAAVAVAQTGPGTTGPVRYGLGGINPEAARAKTFPATTTAPVADFPGKKVTLKVQGAPLREAFDTLRDQSAMQFSIPGTTALEQKAVTLDSRDKPLWQTLQALLKEADPSLTLACVVRAPGARGVIRVSSHFSASGAFLVSINRVAHQVSATPGQPERYNVSTSVMSDGTLRLSGVQYESTAKKATDERGNSLVSSLTIARRFVPTDPATFSYPAIIVLEPPAAGDLPKKIAVLEGVLPALFVTTEAVEVAMGQKVEKRFGPYAATISLSPTRGGGNQAQVLLQNKADDSVTDQELADWQQQINAVVFELFDAEGKSLPLDSSGTGVNRRVLSIYANYPPQPISGPVPQPPTPTAMAAKAIVHMPTGFKAVEIPYHFEDVALP